VARIRKRVGKNGTRYQAEVRLEGQCRSATFRTKSEAQKWAKTVESSIIAGKHLPPAASKRKSVQDLMTRYIENVIPSQKDQRNPKRHAEFWIERLGDLRLNRLTPAALVEVRDELSRDRAPSTVNRYLAVISHACTLAEREWGWLESNPVRRVGRLKEPKGRVRYLTDSERERLLKAARDSDHPHLYPIVLIALTTGARRSEILGLRWRDIDFKNRRAVIEHTKNSERRSLALVPQVLDELRKLRKVRRIEDDLVFAHPDTGKPSYFYFEKAWTRVREKAEIEDFRFHDLRHSCASYLAMNGATTAEIAAVLGHKTLAMVKRYSHFSDAHVQGVVERTAEKTLGAP